MQRTLPLIITTLLLITLFFAIWGKHKVTEVDIKPTKPVTAEKPLDIRCFNEDYVEVECKG